MKILLLTILFVFLCATGIGGFVAYQYLNRPEPKPIPKLEEITLRFIEGWTLQDNSDYLVKQGSVTSQEYTQALKDFDRTQFGFLSKLPKGSSLEGFLFPDTYRFLKGVTAEEIIRKQLETFEKKVGARHPEALNSERITISGYKSLSLLEVVALASIVEKETGIDLTKLGANQQDRLNEERRIVAGIFLNRIAIGQALESDATINYATGKNLAAPSTKDLAINSPYNTYKYPGLPPGPICNPSISSIEAVIEATKTDYYFFLHKQPSGEVVYSKTFEEHVQNKFKYLK